MLKACLTEKNGLILRVYIKKMQDFGNFLITI